MTEAKKRTLMVPEMRVMLASYARNDWVVNAEDGTSIQDALDPMYWTHVAPKLKPYDRIELRAETGEWIAELLVMGVDLTWARVVLLKHHDLMPDLEKAPEPQRHEVFWRGPQHKWSIRRLADQEVLQSGFGDKTLAYEWVKNHERVMV